MTVGLIFFGVGQEAAPQVLTRAEHALIVGGADAVAAALHARANLRVLAVWRTKLRARRGVGDGVDDRARRQRLERPRGRIHSRAR